MARSHLTLAALATAAVADFQVVGARPVGSGVHGDFESALAWAADGTHMMVRVPTSERAESEQSADLIALRALSQGVRTRLPFGVPSFLGQVPVGGTRAVVYGYVPGEKVSLFELDGLGGVSESLAEAIAAVHSLPTSVIADAGLPTFTAPELLRSTVSVMDRASETGLVPAALLARWEDATQDSALWQFAPAVINGALSAESFLTDGERVTGVLGWQGLSVGDPARDLFWVLPNESAADAVFGGYHRARGSGDRQLRRRAMLYAELELARWLLHGIHERNTEVVDDAVGMLHGLVDSVSERVDRTLTHNTMPVLAVDEVEALLDERDARRGA